MGLSKAQVGIIQSNWAVIMEDLLENGRVMFAKAFEDSSTHALWKGAPADGPVIESHIKNIFIRLTEVIDKLGDDKSSVALLRQTGITHKGYGINVDTHVRVIGEAIIHMLEKRLGSDFDADAHAAWEAVWDFIVRVMFKEI